ncbi:hypothetical protein KBD59_01060 [Candidatus Gracilibacteria bacterium]|nr:hypothetical protein [Candidatus Gracilibacteria bacterium]
MSGAEFFNPSEGGDAYDPAAFERFKEQMKASGAFIAAAQKAQAQQKVKDDKLAAILLKFIQSNQHRSILILAARLLEENIPASFILSIIILGNEDIQQEVDKYKAELAQHPELPAEKHATEFSLTVGYENHALPLEIRAHIDDWGKGILEAGQAVPFRLLETAINKEGAIKPVVIDLSAAVMSDYFEAVDPEQFAAMSYETFFSFCEFLMQGVMQSIKAQIENQQQLNDSKPPQNP